jgi:hypothetical protein
MEEDSQQSEIEERGEELRRSEITKKWKPQSRN